MPSVDEIVISREEWPAYLEKAYRKEKFPKPRTALGFVKEIPADEMEKLMLVNLVEPVPAAEPKPGESLMRVAFVLR